MLADEVARPPCPPVPGSLQAPGLSGRAQGRARELDPLPGSPSPRTPGRRPGGGRVRWGDPRGTWALRTRPLPRPSVQRVLPICKHFSEGNNPAVAPA